MFLNIIHYLKLWIRLTLNSFQIAFVSRFGAILFTLGKLIRFAFFGVFILIVSGTQALAGYTVGQAVIFYLTFNLIDTLTQLLFRDVYRFRPRIVSGDFDLTLVKPMSPLFRVLLGGADALDLLILVPFSLLLGMAILQFQPSVWALGLYSIFLVNALLIATAFHILVLSLGIITTEIDHAVMIYRDISGMARFPVDIYAQPLRGLITFVIPVGLMMTFPPKALFGLLSPLTVLVACGFGGAFFVFSLKVWRFALTKYSSASS